jgi:hypothetical protein
MYNRETVVVIVFLIGKIVKKTKVKKVKVVYSFKKFRRETRKHGPVKIYTPEEVRAFNIARGLI